MGWLTLVVIGIATFAGLALLRLPRLLWSMAGAALMLGATGYALQGRPMLPGKPATGKPETQVIDPALSDLRAQMFGRFGKESAYLTAADALSQAGSPRYEVESLLGGIRSTPNSQQLWTALGDALARHDGGRLSPAAVLAFEQAHRIEPRHPGPWFFYGVTQLRAGDPLKARQAWRKALSLTTPDASYRAELEKRIVLLDRLIGAIEQP
jgi:Flp pilus assembly protein TadD